ncbi:hypothetical protein TEA_002108 [Camellia sinensis var. sinensis]|uniref:Uncharacterized protein n=1 Tax=Camellia sinensis var. sinensis TaxID=542762 RepID=A0A4S4DCQ5_CAMSN|nr:hypothetical protein TEA_002108 [Camellia sinensis var. sinensis]
MNLIRFHPQFCERKRDLAPLTAELVREFRSDRALGGFLVSGELESPRMCQEELAPAAHQMIVDSFGINTGIGINFGFNTVLVKVSTQIFVFNIVTNKLAYKFKTKLLKHEDFMHEVSIGVTTIGKHHWTPGEQVTNIADSESDSVDSPSLQPYRQSKKFSSGALVLANSFNHLLVAVRSQKHLTVRHGTGASQKCGIEACMQRIMAIRNFISTPFFHFAFIALENADYREILMCMPDNGNVVGWLAALKASKEL